MTGSAAFQNLLLSQVSYTQGSVPWSRSYSLPEWQHGTSSSRRSVPLIHQKNIGPEHGLILRNSTRSAIRRLVTCYIAGLFSRLRWAFSCCFNNDSSSSELTVRHFLTWVCDGTSLMKEATEVMGNFFNHSALVVINRYFILGAISLSVMPRNEVNAWATEEGHRDSLRIIITRDDSIPWLGKSVHYRLPAENLLKHGSSNIYSYFSECALARCSLPS